ncbi:hypothetical protein GCM10008995_01380 [Halobellus salinus]|uniref:Uncharacterized protein n=1 Tax=Halobellus salinus TaxID=931585 RepID=A0A830EDM5_9EURY|nr:hypothetical protein [Halobellus salinus]GGI94885.1 hypothetical protein GCM10008995_01380 [Halobellus salinus]SMP20394.1 hypothetical protein SAMN06265347_107143 [Halobellus salinus]
MSDDDSLFDRARRAVAGPTPAERAAELDDRADGDPSALDDDNVEDLIDLLDADDPEAVTDALHALGSLVRARPGSVEPAVPAVFAGLSERPASEWTGTTLGDASQSFMHDLSRGEVLLHVARSNPAALDPVVDDLADRFAAGTLEPRTIFALAYAVAAAPDRVDVDPSSVAGLVADNLQETVESAAESDDEGWTELSLQPMPTRGYIDLLDRFDDDALGADAVADVRDALETVSRLSHDEETVAAAEEALPDG